MSWFLAFAGFIVLIVLHEFGHFIVAKWTGMRVEKFFLFFPPTLFSVKKGETEYGIGAIPAGGFVKITGMNPDEELEPAVAARGYYHQPVWKRIAVIAAGPVMNLLVAFALLFVLALGIDKATELGVGAVEESSPAASSLQEGDRIVSIDGVRGAQTDDLSKRAEQLSDQVNTHRCAGMDIDGCRAQTPATVIVERDGRPQTLKITPFYDAERERYRLGFQFEQTGFVDADVSAGEAADRSVDFMWDVTSQTVTIITRIFDSEQRKQISGVVGTYEVTRQAIEFDARAALTLIAVISLSLAVINLFPFLPLDGGHIFWSLVEKLRGRPVSFRTMERAGAFGFVLVLFLFFIGLSNDIGRLTGEGFNVR